ncbi:septum formation protein Maf [bacterium (Candidatus Gribaldobacteria) CG_4_10_14_0_2_um_filter_41_16]|uniref:dTTP/UTP pyrophosphatase n=1 Tax=bacterium (Candidatus Gribaldobacteria) CG_4_10_14_0_2_um_filter_41_16 TaxID=2014265 RepID=A0A2M7VJF1_9BACT|nr:MAG: septum formation protein Maf [Parcubacteria group bacterium CG1_02_41_26]PJA01950.1 MAG: septum formation protein Maf [bacterium (Candidatus Gribaldobacteria) CG_4_10_14_0_2_um_filter_41_16]
MRKIILASASPRRRELLKILIGDNFEIKTSDYKEDNSLALLPKDLVLFHSLEKGKDVAKKLSEGIIISADTIVAFENDVLGKSETVENAKEMLNKINGQWVEIITGLAVIDLASKKEFQHLEVAKVKIKQMSEQEIDNYIKTGEPLDKAGAFAVQGKGAVLIEKTDGDFYSVVGLPLFKLNELLTQVGINIFDYK